MKKKPQGRSKAYSGKYHQSFSVPFSYPVIFTSDCFGRNSSALKSAFGPIECGRPHKVMVYLDEGVVKADRSITSRIEKFCRREPSLKLVAPPQVVVGGEKVKNGWAGVRRVMTQLGNNHLCRHSYVVAIGGGSVLDMVGFAASLVHRGLRLIRIPTTVLSQNDAGVGVKNGMDEHGMKNFVGTFSPPDAVVVDYDFLLTLNDVDWRGGISEAFKVAIIRDRNFFKFLESNAEKLDGRSFDAMKELVRRCAVLHLDHIRKSGDPFERNNARPLDFGHWAAHKIEVLSNYRVGHGQAVSVGIALDTAFAAETGLITASDRDRIINALRKCGLPVFSRLLQGAASRRNVIRGLDDFREHLGGELSITLPVGIGKCVEVHDVNRAALLKAILWLSKYRGK